MSTCAAMPLDANLHRTILASCVPCVQTGDEERTATPLILADVVAAQWGQCVPLREQTRDESCRRVFCTELTAHTVCHTLTYILTAILRCLLPSSQVAPALVGARHSFVHHKDDQPHSSPPSRSGSLPSNK